MPNIYHGKASLVESNSSDSWSGTQVDHGEMKMCSINFETEVFEGLVNDHGVGGYGTMELDLTEADSTTRSTLEGYINSDRYFRITSEAGDTYVVHGPVTLQESRDFSDPTNPHVYKIKIRRYVDKAGDFCPAPTDS